MSFESSVGGVVAIAQLAWTVYKSCKDAPKSFQNISAEVLSLHALLKEVEEITSAHILPEARRARLKIICSGCQGVLDDLQNLVDRYERLGTKSRLTWDRMKWGLNDIAELRSRLTSNAVLLSAFASSSQVTVERKLIKLQNEFQNGQHEASVISTQTVESLSVDEKEAWRRIRKELEGIGITIEGFETNKDFIIKWLRDAIASGAFDERAPNTSLSRIADNPSLKESDLAKEQERKKRAKVLPAHPKAPRLVRLATWLFASNEQFVQAASNNDYDEVQRLLDRGINANASSSGQMALHQAAEKGHAKTLLLLVKHGAQVDAKDRRLWTALHFATLSGHETIVKSLLELGARVDTANTESKTALHFAAGEGYEPIVRLLLEYRAHVDTTDRDGSTALHFAASRGHEAIVRLLLESGTQVDATDKNGLTALHYVANNGHSSVMRLLLQHNAYTEAKDEEGWTALHFATNWGHESILRLLLDQGAQVNAENLKGWRALHFAASLDHISLIRLLLENGVEVNVEDQSGWTALHFAASKGHESSIRLLLFDHRAKIDAINREGYTALHLAILGSHWSTVRLLLDCGAQVNTSNFRYENTPLHTAVSMGHEETVRTLIEHNANVNAITKSGKTALKIATERGVEAVEKLLLTL